MSTRERNLAILLFGLTLLGIGGGGGYFFVYEPIRQANADADKLRPEVDDLDLKLAKVRQDAPRLAAVKRRSFPADDGVARREYSEVLARLLRQANVPPGFKITERNTNAVGVPALAGKKPAYAKIAFDVAFDKADMWAVEEFLAAYYKLNVLHQITALEIKSDAAVNRGKPAADRKDLSVRLTTEAIILDGAESRRTLVAVPSAFAGVGGWVGFHAVALSPEAARGLTPPPAAPVLATRTRDYSLLALKDIFHGPLPPPPSLRLDRIADASAEVGKPIPPVKVPVVADPVFAGRVDLTVKVEGDWLPPDAVALDPAAKTLTITPPAGTGSATVTVLAKAENGQEAKASFKVSVKDPSVGRDRKPKDDIAGFIRLVITTTRSDGTAKAVIRDNYNPLQYEVEADPTGVRVTKYYFVGQRPKKDNEYLDKRTLNISDETSGTSRHFRVVAIDGGGLILSDMKPAAPPVEKAPAPKGPFTVKGGAGRDKPAADPLLAVIGPAAAVKSDPASVPVLYRWASGQTLAGLTEVPKDEARKILKQAAETGPVGATAVTAAAGGQDE